MQHAQIISIGDKNRILRLCFITVCLALAGAARGAIANTALEHNTAGQRFLAQRNWQAAANEFRASLNLDPKQPEAHFNAALAYRELGETQRALDEVKTALQLRPSYEEAEIALGLILQQAGQPDKAIAQYEQTLKRHPQSAAAWNWLGVAYLQKNQLDNAETQFRAAIKADPQYVRAYNNLGSTLAQGGDIPASIEVLRSGLKLSPDDTELRLNLGMALRSAGNADEAVHLFESLVKDHPENAAIEYQLGQTLRQKGDLAGAIQALEKALDANGELQEAYYALAATLKQDAAARRRKLPVHKSAGTPQANAAVKRGDLSAAIEAFRQSVEKDPNDADAHYNLGAALWYSGARAEARIELEQAVDLNPAAANACSFLGMVYREAGDLPRARRMFQHALALNPTTPYPYFDLAVIYLRQHQLEPAVAQFESGLNLGLPETSIPDLELAIRELRQAVAQGPKNADAQNTLGRLLGWAGAGEKQIIAAFQEAIRLRPDFAEAYNNLGLVYTQSGDDEKAAAAFREALKIRPNFADAHQNLGTVLITSDSAEAVRELRKAITLQPRLLKAQYNLALAYDANPDDGLDKEIDQLQKLLAIDPKYPHAEFALGKALLKSGKLNEAVAHLQTAVENEPKSGEALYQLGLALSRTGRKQEGADAMVKSREFTTAKEREQTATLDLREGRAALDAGKTDEALVRFKRVVALQPYAPEAQYYLGLALKKDGDTAEAEAAFRRAIELRPGYTEARRELAGNIAPIETAIRESKFKEAEQLLHAYVDVNPKSSWGWYALGYSFYGQRKLGESIRALTQSLQLDVKNAEAHKVLGRDLMIVGRFDAARIEFEQGMHCDPKSAEMPYNMGKLYSIQDNWALAKQNFEHALALDPSYMEAYDGLGLALESLGDKEGAIANYQKAIDLNEARHGKFGAPYVNMSALYNAAGNPKMAVTFAERGLEVNASSDRALYQMAKAHEQQGATEEAVASLNHAIAINPRASAYFYLLATAYRRLGRVDESRRAMASFTELNKLSNELEQKRLDWFKETAESQP